ncbi:MAG TPA: YdeI/OmpD-associated family protein, partial [Thermoanaerobaculia bacterium]|nr:YdeI/OmpD-associated family protein [Thermoanaerobaculia bacterium]
DTTVRRIDDEHYTQRFTPRSNDRNWSKINIERFDRMEREGKMTEAGRTRRAAQILPPRKRLEAGDPVPEFIAAELKKHPKALAFFETLAPGYRRDYLRWISEPKREETRAKRLREAIGKLESGAKRRG